MRVHPYQPRTIHCLELWEPLGFRIKFYGIRHGGERPDPELVEKARPHLKSCLADEALDRPHYGVGVAGVHQGRTGDLAFIAWWEEENELFMHVFTEGHGQGNGFFPASGLGLSATPWELEILAFEARAWRETVLHSPHGPDLDAYLQRRLSLTV